MSVSGMASSSVCPRDRITERSIKEDCRGEAIEYPEELRDDYCFGDGWEHDGVVE